MQNDHKWYVLKVITGKEKTVHCHLDAELARSNLTAYVSQVLIPSEKVYEMRAGKKQLRDRKFFPGYILIQADLSDGRLIHLMKEIPNAMGFLGVRGFGSSIQPVPIREKEMHRILGKVNEVLESVNDLHSSFIIGETIRIADGPFAGFSGTIQENFEERKKLNVIVKIFERNTPIELTYAQVEKVM